MDTGLLVFAWHNVEGTWCFPSAPGVGPRGLARQLRFLQRAAHVVPLAEAFRALREGTGLPPRAVAITFDDGYHDNLRLAVPLLEGLQLPATFFLVPGLLSGGVEPWWEKLGWAFSQGRPGYLAWEGATYGLGTQRDRFTAFRQIAERLKRRNRAAREKALQELVDALAPTGSPGELFLDWDGARALARRGFAIGSHSMYHAILTEESNDEQYRDVAESRRTLEEELDLPVEVLAYPNGTALDYDLTTIEAARRAGYVGAVTTCGGRNRTTTPPFEIRRFVVSPHRGLGEFALAIRHLPVVNPIYRAIRSCRRIGHGTHFVPAC